MHSRGGNPQNPDINGNESIYFLVLCLDARAPAFYFIDRAKRAEKRCVIDRHAIILSSDDGYDSVRDPEI